MEAENAELGFFQFSRPSNTAGSRSVTTASAGSRGLALPVRLTTVQQKGGLRVSRKPPIRLYGPTKLDWLAHRKDAI